MLHVDPVDDLMRNRTSDVTEEHVIITLPPSEEEAVKPKLDNHKTVRIFPDQIYNLKTPLHY